MLPPALPARPNAPWWNVHGVTVAPPAGCSHQPCGAIRSTLPSPLMSPAPMPWMLPPHDPAPETSYVFHGPVGLAASDVAHCTLLSPAKIASALPSPFTSLNMIDSETTAGNTV